MESFKLRRAYEEYNRKYFENKLPEVDEVVLRWSKRELSICGYNKGDEIVINRKDRKRDSIWKMTLLHEMCHLATEHEQALHGKLWKKEMRRLARIGAFDKIW